MNRAQGANLIPWLLIGGTVLFLAFIFFPRPSNAMDLEITEVIRLAEAGEVAKIEVREDKLKVITKNGETFNSRKESSDSVLELLGARGIATDSEGIMVDVKGKGVSFGGTFLSLLCWQPAKMGHFC